MGHRKKGTQQSAYTKDLKDQMYGRLTEMLAAGKGRSKKVDAPAGVDRDKIYSFSTYESYFKHCKYFADFVQERHPECTTLRAAKKYVVEWLTYRMTHDSEQTGKPLSVWTLDLERQALCKLFQIKPDDPQFVQLPKRRREDIKRSRGPAVRDKHFSERNNWEFVCFCRGTGGRRAALEKLEGRDLFTKTEINKRIARLQVKQAQGKLSPEEEHDLTALLDAATQFADHEYFICWRRDKGGKTRSSSGCRRRPRTTRYGCTCPATPTYTATEGSTRRRSTRCTPVLSTRSRTTSLGQAAGTVRGIGISPASITVAVTSGGKSWTRRR